MDNKKITILIVITMAMVAAVLVFAFLGSFNIGKASTSNISSDKAAQGDVIAVYGQGKISIKPDIAYLTFGVENTDIDPQKAQDFNSLQMDKVIKAIKNADIEDKDIQTMQYNVYQEYDYKSNEREVIGYRVTNTVRIKLEDIDKAGDIIKIVYDAGANRFDGIRFDIIKRQEAYIEALDIALERAREKADRLAQNTSRKITSIVSIQESGSSSSTYHSPLSNFAVSDAESLSSYSSGAISSGEMEISAVVNVVYRLE